MSELETASFDVDRFEVGSDACLEVHGRWSGVRGRRFMRPALTAVAGGREHRLLAVLDHKPWVPAEGEPWIAAFPWSTDPAGLSEAELTVAPDVTVPLPPLSLPKGDRRRRSGRGGSRERKGDHDTESRSSSKDARLRDESRLLEEHDRALGLRDEALSELDAVKRDRDRLREELGQALAAREAALGERHDAIEAEVSLRIADLRAEAERERAAAGQAAQLARERDSARAECARALGERDEALAERDSALLERNRMLAQRDTASSKAEEAMRRWEATAALGTRRTQQRDAAVGERDRAARERDAGLAQIDRLAHERDAAIEQLELARAESVMPAERAATQSDPADRVERPHEESILKTNEPAPRPKAVRVSPRPLQSDGLGRPPRPMYPVRHRAGRPQQPPAPDADRHRRDAVSRRERRPYLSLGSDTEASEMWRARLLAVAGLLVAFVAFLVILVAK